jgi:HK97 family phage major capsid protein
MTERTTAPEIKSGDVAEAYESLARTFEEFKSTNEDRIAEIERRNSADVLTEEKLSRIDRRLDELTLKARRPALGGVEEKFDSSTREHKAAFNTYVRFGEADGLKRLEAKALSAGSGPDGGYLVPVNAERDILRRMAAISPIRAIAATKVVSTNSYKKAFSATGPAVGWVAETAARPVTNSQTLADLTFPTFEIYAQPAATQMLLDDSAVDIEAWIADEVETVFAEQEGAAFVNGNGTTQPKGFLNYTKVANASWSWGNLGYLATGVAGNFAASNASDVLVDLVHAVKAGYRQNGTFVMGRKTQSAVRKLKDTTGNYLWQPPATVGAQASLMNFPVVEAEDMPDIATDSFSLAFGDFRRGYLIVDRMGIRILRDPYSNKPYVQFYTTKRVGGGVQDFEAIKLLKFGVS